MADWYAGYSEVVCTCAYKKSPLLLSGYCALLGLEEAVATDPAVGRSAVAEFVHIAAEDDVAGLAEMFVVRHEVDFEIVSARGTDLLPRLQDGAGKAVTAGPQRVVRDDQPVRVGRVEPSMSGYTNRLHEPPRTPGHTRRAASEWASGSAGPNVFPRFSMIWFIWASLMIISIKGPRGAPVSVMARP